MAETAADPKLTSEEYLAWERAQPQKHEYLDGEIFAMAGASPAHNQIVANLLGELRSVLRDKPCRVFASDQRVKIPQSRSYVYPDASVACGRPEYEDAQRDTLLNPTVVVEVLSRSTEYHDRHRKARKYRAVTSISDYLLVEQDDVWVEHYVRGPDGAWRLYDTLPGGTIKLASCGVEVRVNELYLKVFDEA